MHSSIAVNQLKRSGYWAGIVGLLFWQPALFAEAPQTPEPTVAIPEVDVTAERYSDFWRLHQEMDQAEERFYTRYNELIAAPRFKVHCQTEAPTGSRLTAQVCRGQFIDDATSEEAKALMEGRPYFPAYAVVNREYGEFRRQMLAVLTKDPQLRKLLADRILSEARYEALRQRVYGKWAGRPADILGLTKVLAR